MITDCWKCLHMRRIAGNDHISCANPDKQMKGNAHGIKNGWFNYPYCFDPVWMETECANYEEIDNNAA